MSSILASSRMARGPALASMATQHPLAHVALGLALSASVLCACGSPDVGTPGSAQPSAQPSAEPGAEPSVDLGQLGQRILGGSRDDAHPEVMLLADAAGFLCTGTNIRVDGGSGFLLTAAHCVTEVAGRAGGVVPLDPARFLVVPGTDFAESSLAFAVEAITVEPSYDGGFAADDIAIVRFFVGDGPAPGTIEPLAAEDDELALNDELLLIGYGQTELATPNTERRSVARSVDGLDQELVAYSQEDGDGACFGDSGGPGLVQVDGEERLGLVISGGVAVAGDDCASGIGLAMRVSAYAGFIEGVLSGGLD